MPSSNPTDRFKDIIENIDAIASYSAGMTKEQYRSDRKTRDATERCLSRISEAAVKLGLLAEELAPEQPWKDIRGLGNWLRHDYPSHHVGHHLGHDHKRPEAAAPELRWCNT